MFLMPGKDEETAKVTAMPVTNTMYDMYENAGQIFIFTDIIQLLKRCKEIVA